MIGAALHCAFPLAGAGTDTSGAPPVPPPRLAPVTATDPLIAHTIYSWYSREGLAKTAALQQAKLLARLEDGFYLAIPAGTVQLDAASGRFELRAAAVAVRHGRPAVAHPLVSVRGSLRRILGGLTAVGGDSESFSLACAVTTPSLLFRRLEIA